MPLRQDWLCFDLHRPITVGRLSGVLWAVAGLTSVTDFADSSWLWLIYDTITLRFSGPSSKISSSSVCPLTSLWHLLSDMLESLFWQMWSLCSLRKWIEVRQVCHFNCPGSLCHDTGETPHAKFIST